MQFWVDWYSKSLSSKHGEKSVFGHGSSFANLYQASH